MAPSQNTSTTSRRSVSSSSYNGFRGIRESSIEETEEYEYAENNSRKSSGYSMIRRSSSTRNSFSGSRGSNMTNGYSSSNNNNNSMKKGSGNVSLAGLQKPKIESWDSMGILGLTSKMWNDTKTRQETFMESTGRILREETTSYIM